MWLGYTGGRGHKEADLVGFGVNVSYQAEEEEAVLVEAAVTVWEKPV